MRRNIDGKKSVRGSVTSSASEIPSPRNGANGIAGSVNMMMSLEELSFNLCPENVVDV